MSPSAIAAGLSAPPRTYGPITRTDIVRYAGASGDFNPLHHDDEVARSAGFPSVFSIGMLQAGILASYATDWLGTDTVRRFSVRFSEQVWPGDELTCEGSVSAVEQVGDEQLVTVDLVARRQTGAVAVQASADFSLRVDQPVPTPK